VRPRPQSQPTTPIFASLKPLLLGPTFAVSGALGGADADFIAGGLLLDLKAAATTRIVRGEGLWQLAGYALADTHDRFTLRDVGISALRWRSRWVIALDELLSRLAGQSMDVSDLRREFAEVATAAPLGGMPSRARWSSGRA
jgi:hypothetical protein